MQVPALFRRGVVVPLTGEAEASMRSWFAEPTNSVLHLRIDNDEEFNSLLDTNVFAKLNQACGVIIDDYEEEIIEPGQLDKAIKVILELGEEPKAEAHRHFFYRLLELFERARAEQRPVFFIL